MRTTQRQRKDGSIVRYVQLAHNRRVGGVTQAEVLLKLGPQAAIYTATAIKPPPRVTALQPA